jgi:hypothetical protein
LFKLKKRVEGGGIVVLEILKKGVGLALLLLFISACGEIGGSGQCGGGEATGSCVRIESITPKYRDKNTSSVDVVQGNCGTGTSTPEFFAAHNAELVISNRPIPPLKKEDISDVTIQNFSISYVKVLNNCPLGATCPPLISRDLLGQTVRVPVDGSVTVTLPFFDLASKKEYTDLFGSTSAFPRYNANYRITGTDSNKKSISVEGSAEFEIGNFDNCDE